MISVIPCLLIYGQLKDVYLFCMSTLIRQAYWLTIEFIGSLYNLIKENYDVE